MGRQPLVAGRVRAAPTAAFKRDNVRFVVENTGIPTSFATVVALGVIVGVCVVGLLTNLFVLENLKQFAALKAKAASGMRSRNSTS